MNIIIKAEECSNGYTDHEEEEIKSGAGNFALTAKALRYTVSTRWNL